jgi:hypothetical protein
MLILLAVLGLCFITSLIPFLYPYTVLNTLGAFLNHVLGQALWAALGETVAPLVSGSEGVYGLTLMGVFAVYGVPILVILFVLRGR